MSELGRFAYLRAATPGDDDLLHDIFASTWETETLTLPEPILATHFLRVQHIAQEARFARKFPHLERFVITSDGDPAGRLYVQRYGPVIQCVDITLLPKYRDKGIGTRVMEDLFEEAADGDKRVTLRVPRENDRAVALYESLGFTLVAMDDQDKYFEWCPRAHPVGRCSSHSVP